MIEVRIGRAHHDFLRIAVLQREHPEANDYWDGNWLAASVDVRSGAFSGVVACCLRSEDFPPFREQLALILANHAGKASFTTMETQLALDVTAERNRGLRVQGSLAEQAGGANRLSFRIQLDESFLPEVIARLDQVISEYPVLGSPRGA